MKKILIALNATLMALPIFNKAQSEEIVHVENIKNVSTEIINLNFADVQKLEKVDGISNKIAIAIVDYRSKNGFFKSIEQVMEVSGIGPVTYEKIKSKLCV